MARQKIILDPVSGLDSAYIEGIEPPFTEKSLPRAEPIAPGASATVSAQVWLERFPWRPAAAWSALCALLSLNAFAWPALDWRDVVLLLLLVDPLWGSIWRLVAGRTGTLPIRAQIATQRLWLPYLEPGSPATRLLGWDDETALPLLFRVVLPGVALALAVGVVMGPLAIGMTLLLIVLSAIGWVLQRTWHHPPLELQSIVAIALPWGLTLITFRAAYTDANWTPQIALLALWTIHHWGECRSIQFPGDHAGIVALAAADVGIGILLILVRAPLWLALLSIVWLPTWFMVYQRQPLGRIRFWWLVAMLMSALALGVRG